jgi:hypothetical protein
MPNRCARTCAPDTGLVRKAEYEPDDIAPGVATKALERAQRCVAVARTVAAGSG